MDRRRTALGTDGATALGALVGLVLVATACAADATVGPLPRGAAPAAVAEAAEGCPSRGHADGRRTGRRLPANLARAALGYVVGRTVVRVNSTPPARGAGTGATLTIAPIVGRGARGLQMSLVF
jgi:hypothetical protein